MKNFILGVATIILSVAYFAEPVSAQAPGDRVATLVGELAVQAWWSAFRRFGVTKQLSLWEGTRLAWRSL